MKAIFKTTLLTAAVLVCTHVAQASYADIVNQKANCAIFKNNKLQKKVKCTANGRAQANMYMGNFSYGFKPIAGYGKFETDSFFQSKVSPNGIDLVLDQNGYAIIDRESHTLNGKSAVARYRDVKTNKVLTKSQYRTYQTTGKPYYSCLYAKGKPQLEFCHDIMP